MESIGCGMDKRIVAGLGEMLWDVFTNKKILGGAPVNFAYHATQLGMEGYAVTAVGEDEDGRQAIERLEEKGVKHLTARTEYPTGSVRINLSGKGIPEYVFAEDVAWDHIPFESRLGELAAKASAVCFDTLAQRCPESRETVRRFIGRVPEGCLRVFDMNLRGNFYSRAVIEESMAMADVLKINEEELAVVGKMLSLTGGEKERCLRLKMGYGLSIVILTRGAEGSFVFWADDTSFLPSPNVEVIDTVGAGDSFTAAFISGILKGMPVLDAHRLAVDVSAYVCGQSGAMPPMPDEFGRRGSASR